MPTTRFGRDAIPCVRRAVEGIASPLRRRRPPCDDRTAQSPSPPGPTMRAPSWPAVLARVDHGAPYYPARPRGPAVEGLASRRRQTTEDGRSRDRWHPLLILGPSRGFFFFCSARDCFDCFVLLPRPRKPRVRSSPVHNRRGAVWLLAPNSQAGAVPCPRNHSDRAVDDVARDPPIPPSARTHKHA